MNKNDAPRRRWLWLGILILSLLLLLGCVLWYVLANRPDVVEPEDYHRKDVGLVAPDQPPFWGTDPSRSHSGSDTVPESDSDPESPSSLPEETDPGTTSETELTPIETETLPPPETDPLPVPTSEPETETTEPRLPENPVDFDALQRRNSDVYAWIWIPMGEKYPPDIDYPILQSSTEMDDNFYLHHNIDKNYQYSGCIYTQKQNAKDFSDRVTLVYGHNMLNSTMFSHLVYFQDSQFFREHEYFYIFTPGHILTYRIAAAIQFDDRHILNNFDFSDDDVYANWIENYILHPRTMNRSTREGVTVTTDDKLVILSTCLEHGAYRYLIQGVLINDVPTN